MTQIEFIKGMKLLQGSYSKDFTDDEIAIWFIQFENVKAEDFYKAVNETIRKSKYMPSIAELLEKCEKVKIYKRYEILEIMKENNYFKTPNEYDKAIMWAENETIPKWLKEDMKKFYNNFIAQKEIKQIGGIK
jgi:hypothetical protein